MSHSSQLPPIDKDPFTTKMDSHMKKRDLGKSTTTDNVIS